MRRCHTLLKHATLSLGTSLGHLCSCQPSRGGERSRASMAWHRSAIGNASRRVGATDGLLPRRQCPARSIRSRSLTWMAPGSTSIRLTSAVSLSLFLTPAFSLHSCSTRLGFLCILNDTTWLEVQACCERWVCGLIIRYECYHLWRSRLTVRVI